MHFYIFILILIVPQRQRGCVITNTFGLLPPSMEQVARLTQKEVGRGNWLRFPLRNMWQWSDSIGKIEPTKSNHDNQVTIILLKFYITAYRGNSSLHNYGIHGPVERGRILG